MSTSTKVFIPDDEFIWLAAEVLVDANEQGMVEVQVQDEIIHQEVGSRLVSLRKFGLSALPLQNPDVNSEGVEDMCSLSYLHEASILDNLRRLKILGHFGAH